ncbi:MAG: hypothetical protein AAFY84_00585 [Pseudomonadota bacterium]
MKAFQLRSEQIAAVTGALIADELASRFRRHIDYVTAASLSPDEPVREGKLRLNDNEIEACAERVAAFFGFDHAELDYAPDVSIRNWGDHIDGVLTLNLKRFRFTPAGRDSRSEFCEHRADAVFAEAGAIANLLYGRRRLISLVAPHSLTGFVLSILTPNLQRIDAIDARAKQPSDLTESLAFGDAVVATPTQWRFLLREGLKAPDNAVGVVFGEAMTVELASALRKAGFAAQRELYGSTESGLIAWRDSPNDPFVLFEFLARTNDQLVRTMPSGETKNVTPMDELEWISDRTFRLGPRRDGAVQVGAINVFPERVGRIISEHEDIEACEIRSGENSTGYNRLIADITLERGKSPTESLARSIDQWCRAKLQPHERPRIYNFGRSEKTDAS